MPLDPEALTWTALLGQWMHFAQGSLALPANEQGQRWRDSVAAIINLQAVTFALGDLCRLPQREWPLALDKADMIITEHTAALDRIWRIETPTSVREIIDDARTALESARRLGLASP